MWTFEGRQFTDNDIGDNVGFVYIITNKNNNRRYIGKKNFYFSKTRQVNKKKKRYKAISDYQDYYGSNKELLLDVDKYGKQSFEREIIKLCKTKGDFAYYEAKAQFDNDVLLFPDLWYNSWISCRINRKHLTGVWRNR